MSIVIKLPLSNSPEHESGCPDTLLTLVAIRGFRNVNFAEKHTLPSSAFSNIWAKG